MECKISEMTFLTPEQLDTSIVCLVCKCEINCADEGVLVPIWTCDSDEDGDDTEKLEQKVLDVNLYHNITKFHWERDRAHLTELALALGDQLPSLVVDCIHEFASPTGAQSPLARRSTFSSTACSTVRKAAVVRAEEQERKRIRRGTKRLR